MTWDILDSFGTKKMFASAWVDLSKIVKLKAWGKASLSFVTWIL